MTESKNLSGEERKFEDFSIYIVEGNLTRDAEYRAYSDDMGWAEFTLASTIRPTSKTFLTNFLRCEVAGKRAERMAKRLKKGQRVLCTGRIKIRQYEHKGEQRTVTEFMVNTIRPLAKWGDPIEPDAALEGDGLVAALKDQFAAEPVDDDDIVF